MPAPAEPEEVVEQDCRMTLTAVEMKLAMVQLSLSLCHANRVLAMHHENMMFNAMTDDNGELVVDVPPGRKCVLYRGI